MVYKGIVRGNTVELEDQVVLPEGIEVEVVVREPEREELAPSGHPKGSRQALLAAFDAPPQCTSADVDVLMEAIEQGKRPVRFEGEGVFHRGTLCP